MLMNYKDRLIIKNQHIKLCYNKILVIRIFHSKCHFQEEERADKLKKIFLCPLHLLHAYVAEKCL